jgi:hypothetical protein
VSDRCFPRSGTAIPHTGAQRGPADLQSVVGGVLNSPGQSLDASTRASMESSFGHDFSHVRVHADERAGESSAALAANAYTVGNHIAFAPGRYQPQSSAGRHLLAHELAHVVQQGTSGSHFQPPTRISAPAEPAERAADTAAAQVVQHQMPSLHQSSVSADVLHRDTDDSAKGQGAKKQVSVEIAVLGDSPNPRKIAEGIPGALAMLRTAENFLIDYPYLERGQQALVDGLLQAHFGANTRQVRNKVHGRIIHMTRLMEAAGSAQLTFDCRPKKGKCVSKADGMWIHRGEGNVIHVCPSFYEEGLEGRRMLLIHEAAHLSGAVGPEQYFVIAGPVGLAECLKPTTLAPEAAIENADSYSWFVWCLSRQPGETVMRGVDIEARPQTPGKKP